MSEYEFGPEEIDIHRECEEWESEPIPVMDMSGDGSSYSDWN